MRKISIVLLALPALLAACAPPPPQGVLLIVVDTLRRDHLGLYGYPRHTSPELDRLAAEAVVFDHAFTTSSWTLPSVASILTGHYPGRHGAGRRPPDQPKRKTAITRSLPTLAELLPAAVASGAVVSNPWLGAEFGLSRGFGTWDYASPRRADEGVDRALAWIDEHGAGPFLLLLHLMDPHLPYDAPAPFGGRFADPEAGFPEPEMKRLRRLADRLAPEEVASVTARYDEEIAFVDHQLGRLFGELENRGLLSRVVVLLTSDHGEELFDHGGFEHGHQVHAELVRAPLLAWAPGAEPRREERPASLVDLLPTVLEALGVEPPEEIAGRSLLPSIRGAADEATPDTERRRLFAEGTLYGQPRRAVVAWPLKLSVVGWNRRLELYDLEADPGERRNLVDRRPAEAGKLHELLRAHLAARGEAGQAVVPTSKVEHQLRLLGYID